MITTVVDCAKTRNILEVMTFQKSGQFGGLQTSISEARSKHHDKKIREKQPEIDHSAVEHLRKNHDEVVQTPVNQLDFS